MTFTIEEVDKRLKQSRLDLSGIEAVRRDRLAHFVEARYKDYVEAWEIRSGRPWTEMTQEEASNLCERHPHMKGNPAVLQKLLGRRK